MSSMVIKKANAKLFLSCRVQRFGVSAFLRCVALKRLAPRTISQQTYGSSVSITTQVQYEVGDASDDEEVPDPHEIDQYEQGCVRQEYAKDATGHAQTAPRPRKGLQDQLVPFGF